MYLFEKMPEFMPAMEFLKETPKSFGERFVNSKYARPYRYKSQRALANYRSGNKKKLHQFVG
jgi:hypothetical protein